MTESQQQLRETILKIIENLDTYTTRSIAGLLIDGYSTVVDTWFQESATQILAIEVQRVLGETRRGRSWSTTIKDVDTGIERPARSVFSLAFAVDDDNRWKPLGEMTGKDHMFVANDRAQRAWANTLEHNRHLFLAEQVGRKKTKNVFSEKKLIEIMDRFSPAQNKTEAVA